jgi:hypothetical protein
MTVIDDLVSAANDYPTTSVVVEIADVTFPGTVINGLEEGNFRVKITNNGPLEIDNLKLTISGENGVQVKGNSMIATYGPTLDLHMHETVPPHSTVDVNTGPRLRLHGAVKFLDRFEGVDQGDARRVRCQPRQHVERTERAIAGVEVDLQGTVNPK